MNDISVETRATESSLQAGPGTVSLAIFLAFAALLFGVILVGYGVMRFNDPEAFAWAPTLLDRRLGIAAAAALFVAVIAALGALSLAFKGRTRAARALLAVVVLAGGAVLAVRALEYPSTSRLAGFLPRVDATPAAGSSKRTSPSATVVLASADPAHGRSVFLKTCAACHAPDGVGVRGQGANLRDSEFVKAKTDAQLLAFVKVGRQPFDPETKLHLAMPARGGNPALTDQDLFDAISNVRQIQKTASAQAAAAPAATGSRPVNLAGPTIGSPTQSTDQPQVIDGELWLPHSILPPSNPGPIGSNHSVVALQRVGASARTVSNVQRFFTIVLLLNGLEAIYLAFGLAFVVWVLFGVSRGAAPRLSLAHAAVYWAIIGGIGLALVPALYI